MIRANLLTFFLAIALHIALICCLLLAAKKPANQLGLINVEFTLLADNIASKHNLSAVVVQKNLAVTDKIHYKKIIKPAKQNKISQQANNKNNFLRSVKTNTTPSAILSMLHQAIAKQQQYPEEALQQEQRGKVVVGFLLTPANTLENIHLVKSSGFAALDAAALTATTEASPLSQQAALVQKPTYFTVEILFV